MHIPETFLEQSNGHDKVYTAGDNTVVFLDRNFESERSHVVLNKHVISFGLEGYKVFHSALQDVIVEKGETIFLKKGLLISTEKILEKGSYQAIVFFLDDQFLASFYQENQHFFKCNGDSFPAYFKIEEDPILKSYVQSLIPYFQDGGKLPIPLFETKVKELLLNLALNNQGGFCDFLVNINLQMNIGLKPFMEKNYKRNLRVEDFAHLLGMSLSGFKREFVKAFQESPARWIKSRRLEEASKLLIRSNMNIGEVGYEVGFENSSHFIQSFKAYFGLTPKKFQDNNL